MRDKAKKALDRAMEKVDQAEIYLSQQTELVIELRKGEVETLKQASSSGLGIRVFKDKQLGFSFTSDLSSQALERAVDQACENASYTQSDPFNGLCQPPNKKYPTLSFDPSISQRSVEEKVDLLVKTEEAAKNYDGRIDQIEACGYEDLVERQIILSSEGVDVDHQSSYCGLYVSLLARQAEEVQTGFALDFKRAYKDLDGPACGRRAAKEAVAMLGAESMDTGQVNLVFDPYTTTSLLGVLASSFSGENVLKGRSMLVGRLGEKVMSPLLTIVDDGRLADGVMSSPADAEGLASQENVLVKEGRLETFLHNAYTARRAKTHSTASARRAGFSGRLGVGTSNLYLRPGQMTEDVLLGTVADGLYVTSLLGMHTADPISGDFSIGASGRRIRQGKLSEAVRGVVISGNLLDLFEGVEGLADNLTFFAGSGAPSLKTAPMTVSGK